MNAKSKTQPQFSIGQSSESIQHPITVQEILQERYAIMRSVRAVVDDLARRGVITRPKHLRIGVGR